MANSIVDQIDESISGLESGHIYRTVIGKTEKILIEKALERCYGNQLTASKFLGLNRNTLRAKIKKLNINMEKFRT